MKKEYAKPTLVKRDALLTVTAIIAVPISDFDLN